MAEASKQATSPKRKQLRNVMTGQSLCAAAPLELPYATSTDGKISSLAVIFFIDLVSQEKSYELRLKGLIGDDQLLPAARHHGADVRRGGFLQNR